MRISTYLRIAARTLFEVAFLNPIMHIAAVIDTPSSVVNVLLVGPIVGLGVFLTNPKSLLASASACVATMLIVPALPLGALVGVGLGVNALFGFAQSVVTRARNEAELGEALGDDQGFGHLDFEGRKSMVNERFPHGLGPIATALHYDYLSANIASNFFGTYLPYRTREVYHMPEAQGGLDSCSATRRATGHFVY